MSRFKVRALRAVLVVPLLMGSALVASAGHASASINPDNVDRPKISAGDYVNNLAWQSTRVEVDYHDFSHNELHTWDSATFTPVDNKKHEYVISDAVYGSEDVDHIIIKIDAFENGSWKTKGTAVESPPDAHPS